MPASGKTTFSHYAADYFHIPLFSKDEIKERLYDTIGFQSREEKVSLGIGAMEIMYYSAEALMKCSLPFALDNNFEHISRDGITALVKKYQYSPITINFTGNMETIYQRFIQRDKNPERHRGHVVNTCYPEMTNTQRYEPITYKQFVNGVMQRGMFDFSLGKKIEVDSTEFGTVSYQDICNQIANMIHQI